MTEPTPIQTEPHAEAHVDLDPAYLAGLGAELERERGSVEDFLEAFRTQPNFAWSKINHGFWEAMGKVETRFGRKLQPEDFAQADKLCTRRAFFTDGFVGELLELLEGRFEREDPHLHLCFGLSAWPGDHEIIGTPFNPEESSRALAPYARLQSEAFDGLLLKRAIHDGSLSLLLEELRQHRIVMVGPQLLEGFLEFVGIEDGLLIPIHPSNGRKTRHETEAALVAAIEERGDEAVVLLQAGTLAPYWILRLRDRFPKVRWIDGGLAFSISAPTDLLRRPWGKVYRREIVRFHNRRLRERGLDWAPFEEEARFTEVRDLLRERADRQESATPEDGPTRFIEAKDPDETRVAELLGHARREGQWANGGPLFEVLAESYARYTSTAAGRAFLPCANGGVALEGLARLHDLKRFGTKPGKQRWVLSAFTFRNQGRGYFADSQVLDCDAHGMLCLEALAALDPSTYDGIVVTNIFGVWKDFDAYTAFAREHGKDLLIDNAAGMAPELPDWPYQAFSLHHTKPYGAGEGGLALVPAEERAALAELFGYGDMEGIHPSHWVNNGKISEIACAYHLDRLERAPEWAPRYAMQAVRIQHLARRAGLQPLFDSHPVHAAMSLPFLVPGRLPVSGLADPVLTFGKYYAPLVSLPQADALHARIVNVPCHPDVVRIPEEALLHALRGLAARSQEKEA